MRSLNDWKTNNVKRKSQQEKKSSEFVMNGQQITNNSNLEQQYKKVKTEILKKQSQLSSKQKMYKIESFKNQKLKQEIQQIDKHFEITKNKIALQILQKNKQNKESPLFFNQNGLCPFELILLRQKRYQTNFQDSLVCMICFQDILQNQTVIQLPCEHTFHKDCVIQHLLASKICPSCAQDVDILKNSQNMLKKVQKKEF